VIRKLTQNEIDAFFAKVSKAPEHDEDVGYRLSSEETKICQQLVSLGILESIPKLPPPILRAYDPSDEARWVLLDVLMRARVLAHFDAESGFFPVPYGDLLHETLIPIASMLGHVVAGVGRKVEGEQCTYKIAIATRELGFVTSFADSSDYFHVPNLIELWNNLFEAARSQKRFMEIDSEDQTALVLCATRRAAQALADKTGLGISV
jgi:hypothetical protein